MSTHDSPRRRFVIHVFAGLAAATTTSACNRESTNAGSQPANAPVTNPPNAAASADARVAMPIQPSMAAPAIAAAATSDASAASDAMAAAASPDATGVNALTAGLGATDGGGVVGMGAHAGGLGLAGIGTIGGGRMGGGDSMGGGTIGLGGSNGTMGRGRMGQGQGYGSGVGGGRMGGRRGATGPLVRAAPPTVTGPLSPEAIRRVVLRNLGQIAHCHEMGLAQNPNLEGRVTINFVIGPAGAVTMSSVGATTVPVPAVGLCMASAVRRWQFPSPDGGGIVQVQYPFNLQRPE